MCLRLSTFRLSVGRQGFGSLSSLAWKQQQCPLLQAASLGRQAEYGQQLSQRGSLWPSGVALLFLALATQLAEVQPFGVETKGL